MLAPTKQSTKNRFVGDGALDVPPYLMHRRYLNVCKANTSRRSCIISSCAKHTSLAQSVNKKDRPYGRSFSNYLTLKMSYNPHSFS